MESFQELSQSAKTWTPNLIVVNDGSIRGVSDEDIKYIKHNIGRIDWISYEKNRGKGYALRRGINKSRGEYVVYTDIDFPYTQESMINLINELVKSKIDVLAGERGENYYVHTPFVRKVISKFLKKLVWGLLKINVMDTQAGLKGMNRKAKSAFLETSIDRYLFDIEFLWLAGKKFQIAPFPVNLKDNIVFSKMNYKILFTEGINFVKFYIKTLK